jgi:hypothetical protein
MNNLDYYTVMESRIKYFAQKYDPQNKFGHTSNLTLLVKKPREHIPPISKIPLRKKVLIGFDSVISFFL